MAECIFCKIAKKEISSKIVYEDDQTVAFEDINPQAPVHILVIPRHHWKDTVEALAEETLIGHCLAVASKIAQEKGLYPAGFRIVVNTGRQAGQSVDHLHFHLLGGRAMHWPPG